jgi:hypothetical protein
MATRAGFIQQAAKGKYSSETFASINQSLTINPQWNQAWTAVMIQKIKSQ